MLTECERFVHIFLTRNYTGLNGVALNYSVLLLRATPSDTIVIILNS